MSIEALDHVNVRTSRLQEMIDWYDRILGMPSGERPNFPFPGAWIYAGDKPLVHLVEVDPQTPGSTPPQIEHFAFSAKGLSDFIGRFEAAGLDHEVSPVPGLPIVQVHVHDPDGNHIHIDFDASEAG